MEIVTDGIVVGRRESAVGGAVYLDILTDKNGVLEVAARRFSGSSGVNGGSNAACALFCYSQFALRLKGDRYSLLSADLKYSFWALTRDAVPFALAAYFAEVARTVSPEGADSGVFGLLLKVFYECGKSAALPCLLWLKAVFEMRVSALLGQASDFVCCGSCGAPVGFNDGLFIYFDIEKNYLLCGGCARPYSVAGTAQIKITQPVLDTLRQCVFEADTKVFKVAVSLTGEELNMFSKFAEQYFVRQTDVNWKQLKYFHKIILM